MKMKYYHIYADGKTVREISWNEWREIIEKDRNRGNTRLICTISDSELYLRKGRNFLWIRREQLDKILSTEQRKDASRILSKTEQGSSL